MCYRTGKYTLCRRVRVSFSPEILQFEAVNGLMAVGRNENCTVSDFVVVGVAGRGLDADDLGATLLASASVWTRACSVSVWTKLFFVFHSMVTLAALRLCWKVGQMYFLKSLPGRASSAGSSLR